MERLFWKLGLEFGVWLWRCGLGKADESCEKLLEDLHLILLIRRASQSMKCNITISLAILPICLDKCLTKSKTRSPGHFNMGALGKAQQFNKASKLQTIHPAYPKPLSSIERMFTLETLRTRLFTRSPSQRSKTSFGLQSRQSTSHHKTGLSVSDTTPLLQLWVSPGTVSIVSSQLAELAHCLHSSPLFLLIPHRHMLSRLYLAIFVAAWSSRRGQHTKAQAEQPLLWFLCSVRHLLAPLLGQSQSVFGSSNRPANVLPFLCHSCWLRSV